MRVRKLFGILLLLVLLFFTRPVWEEAAGNYIDLSFLDTVDEAVGKVADDTDVSKAFDEARHFTTRISHQLQAIVTESSAVLPEAVAKPELAQTDSLVAVHNVTLGMSKDEAQQKLGLPLRLMENEYGTDWHSYHQDYQNYVLLSYDEQGEVNGMFTNQDLISSTEGFSMDSSKEEIRGLFGTPLSSLQKGRVQYILDSRDEYDLFETADSYTTVFYDVHEENTVTAVQVISKELEDNRSEIYAEPSAEIKQGYEFLLYELTNSARIQRQLPLLKWDEATMGTARKHSQDMADERYFSHTNQQGQSPFDRMKQDGISFFVAGENLAYGQYSAVFAHEGLMNSMGHRENIVKPDFGFLGVGVAFNSDNQPYFTAKFFNR